MPLTTLPLFKKRQARAFTLIELMLVLFIMSLLCAMTIPVFSKLAKTSKVDQASKIVMAALYHARSEAQRYRTAVGVYYGDDCSHISPAPLPNVLPLRGRIEIWTTQSTDGGCFGNGSAPYDPDNVSSPPPWYPYRFPDRKLGESYTLPEGIRVMTGALTVSGNKSYFDFTSYRKDPTGEIKRHHTVYDGRGSMPSYLNYWWSWYHIVVFDEVSGDHIVIEAGQWQSSTRPRILPNTITNVGTGSATQAVTKPSDLPRLLDAFAGNS